jgi:hypothetical protein
MSVASKQNFDTISFYKPKQSLAENSQATNLNKIIENDKMSTATKHET